MKDEFSFNLPFDVIKSANSSSGEWRIGGYASTSSEDRQGDEIIQKGLDYSDFVNFGWFNFDHHNDIILGYPDKDKCRIDSHGLYVEGTLLKGVESAKNIWETALALKNSNSDRKLGFSVEGAVLQRNPAGKIVKAKVYNVAITPNPVNTTCTWDAIVKSFTTDINDLRKAMEAGTGDARNPVIPESLESAFRILSYAVGNDEDSKQKVEKLKKELMENGNEISDKESILYLQLTKGLSYFDAKQLVDKLNESKEDMKNG